MNHFISFALLLLLAPFTLSATEAITCEHNLYTDKCVQVSVVDKSGQAITDIVVYLQPLDGQNITKSSETVTISQYNKAFSPYFTVSQAKNKINFANRDDITHHIYSADKNNKFAFKIRAATTHLSASFDNEVEIAMGCNIHDWMSGYLLIVNTPYFGKTDNNGQISFSLTELGNYRIVIWHPQLSTDNHNVNQEHNILSDSHFIFPLTQNIGAIPMQENNENFDFISDY